MVTFLFSNFAYGVNYTLNNTTWSPSTPNQQNLTNSDSVIIIGGGSWTLTRAITVRGIRLSGGTLEQSFFTLTGTVLVKGAGYSNTISGTGSISGAVTILSGTVTVSNAKSAGSWAMSGGNLTNSANITGTITASKTGELAGTGPVAAVTVSGGTLTVSAAKTATSWTLSGGNLTNSANIAGSISVTSNATLAGAGTVGAVTVTSVTLTVSAAKTASSWTLSNGTLTNNAALTGSISSLGTSTLNGSNATVGAVTVTGGTLTVSAEKDATSWTLSGGNLTNSSNITGSISMSANRTLAGTGSVGAVTVTGGTLTVSAAKTAASWTFNGGNLTNSAAISGAITVSSSSTFNGASSVGAITVTGGTLTINVNKTASSVTLNGGSLNIGERTLTTNVAVSQNATLTSSKNKGVISGDVTISAGTLTVSNSDVEFDTLKLTGGSINSGGANINAAVLVTANGTITGDGNYENITVTGGVLTFGDNTQYNRLTLNGGSANIGSSDPTGPVTVSQSATLTAASGGTIDALTISSGTLTIAGSNMGITTLTMSGGTLSLGSFVLSASDNISITGDATITGSGTGYMNANNRTLTINNGNLTLDNVELIIDNLTFSSAHDISTTNGGILSFNNSSVHTINNAAADRHVIGKIRVYLDNSSTNSNTYPLGDGSAYAPIFLEANGRDSAGTNLSNPSGGFGTHYIDMVYTGSKNSNTTVDNTLPGSASGEEFWTVTRSASKPAAALTFRFSTVNTGSTFSKTRISGTMDTAKLRTDIKVASFNFSTNKWTAMTTAYSIVPAQNYIAVTTSSIAPNTSFTIGSNNVRTAFVTPLPVSLIDFSAKAKDASIEVKWSTASEKDNSAFVVEKSLDGQTWSSIGTVKGAKTSNVVNNYGVVDYKVVAGFQYYRLKQIDLDGSVNYSKAIAVNFSKASTLNVNVFPNPAKDVLNITTENNATGEVNIQILNSMGEAVYNQVVEAGLVQNIDITSFIPGVYYVTVIAEGESKIIRLLKN